jgi:hypothetical protein
MAYVRGTCTFFDRNPHSKMPLSSTPLLRLRRFHTCGQCHSNWGLRRCLSPVETVHCVQTLKARSHLIVVGCLLAVRTMSCRVCTWTAVMCTLTALFLGTAFCLHPPPHHHTLWVYVLISWQARWVVEFPEPSPPLPTLHPLLSIDDTREHAGTVPPIRTAPAHTMDGWSTCIGGRVLSPAVAVTL